MNNTFKQKEPRGFTLLELLIVIAIIAILSVILIIVINPAETLKKARDVQRMSDLNTMKTALGLYATATSSPDFDAAIANHCLAFGASTALISYSVNAPDASACATNLTPGADSVATSDFSPTDFCRYAAASSLVDGTGWLPVDLASLIGGSPVSNLPLDPVNTIATLTAPASTDLVYRYACQNASSGNKPGYVFELNAQLESDAYTSVDNKRAKDGGDNDNYYEVGTNIKLLPATVTTF